MDLVLAAVLGAALGASAVAAIRLMVEPRRVIGPQDAAMQAALHAASSTLPHLRRGLSTETAGRAIGHLRRLVPASAVALADEERVLAFAGVGADHHRPGDPLEPWLRAGRDDRVHAEPVLQCADEACPLQAAVVAPLVVNDERVGSLIALFPSDRRLRPEDLRLVGEAGALVAAQLELSAVAEQEERLAAAELRALRAQISPHFVYNALAAVAGSIHTRPDDARELLTEFAEFIRYAFRAERPYVTLADELGHVEKYLRLEQARFGERLTVRLQVAPEVLQAVVPAFSVQPLVENAVRHGIESAGGSGTVEIIGADLGGDVELSIRDDGGGMAPDRARRALDGDGDGGIGLANVHGRLRSTFGAPYGLAIDSGRARGTTVRMTLPKFHAGVRAA